MAQAPNTCRRRDDRPLQERYLANLFQDLQRFKLQKQDGVFRRIARSRALGQVPCCQRDRNYGATCCRQKQLHRVPSRLPQLFGRRERHRKCTQPQTNSLKFSSTHNHTIFLSASGIDKKHLNLQKLKM